MLFAQIGRFLSVGVLATLLHVCAALLVQKAFAWPAQQANLIGFLSAFSFSYFGHARHTFKVYPARAGHLQRFFVVAFLGLCISSTITLLVTEVFRASFAAAMLAVAICVPALTFVASKFWAFADTSATAKGQDLGPLFVVLFGAGYYAIFHNNLINHDTAWYLIATRKWLDGASLYVDLIEVNPPLNFYLTAPAIWVADLLSIKDIHAQILVLSSLITAALLWCSALIRDAKDQSGSKRLILLIGLALSVTAPYLKDYGQREHLLSIFILPWIAGLILTPNASHTRRAIFAGIGLCLKPHFMLIPICIALFTAIRDRSLRPVFSFSMVTFLLMGLAYIGFVKTAHPEYFEQIVPIALQVYGDYGHDTATVIEKASPLILAAFALLVFSLYRAPLLAKLTPVLAAALAASVIYAVQWTGYGYQMKPAIALIVLACVMTLTLRESRRLSLVLAVLCLGVFSFDSYQTGVYKSKTTANLGGDLKALGPNPRLAVLSSSLWPAFPLANEAGAIWTSRYPALWLIPGAVNRLASPDCTSGSLNCDAIRDIFRDTRAAIVEDFLSGEADMLIVDKHPYYINEPDFSYLALLGSDENFQKRFSEYKLLKSSEKFDVYVRVDE